jgi:hypothetical protein
MNRIRDHIDKLISAEIEVHPERLVSFFERVQSNYDESIRATTRFFLLMLAAWFFALAIDQKWIDKVPLLGIDLNRQMIVVSPLLVGLLSYETLSSFAAAIVLWEAISQHVRRTLPVAWQHSLDDLLGPPTFSNVERMLEPKREKVLLWLFSRAWFGIIGLTMLGGSLVAIIHTTGIIWNETASIYSMPLKFLTAPFGMLVWLRGLVLVFSSMVATGGFKGAHHRASGRAGV